MQLPQTFVPPLRTGAPGVHAPTASPISPVSLWDLTAGEPPPLVPLDGDTLTEVAIVGGGFTGLSTALHLAEAGIDCRVLEAGRIGQGGSGRNVGLVNAGLWLPPKQVRDRLGEERGARLIEALGAAPDVVFSLIDRHRMRCECTRTGTLHAAHSAAGFEDLARRHEQWRDLGAPVELLSAHDAAARIGSEAFHGALLDRRAGTINPMGYARGLARAAHEAGARLHTDTCVTRLTRHGEHWRLDTPAGSVSARSVVLATNAYTDALWPGLARTVTPIHYFQLATEPLGERAAHILPQRQGLWDTGRIMFSLRRDAADRLIIGSMGRVIGGSRGLSERWAQHTLRRLFPALGEVRFEHRWHGRIAMTPDHLPRIHRLAENLYTPIGYNGRGIAPGTLFGRAIAERLNGGSDDNLPMPPSEPRPVAAGRVATRLYGAAFAANQWVRSLT